MPVLEECLNGALFLLLHLLRWAHQWIPYESRCSWRFSMNGRTMQIFHGVCRFLSLPCECLVIQSTGTTKGEREKWELHKSLLPCITTLNTHIGKSSGSFIVASWDSSVQKHYSMTTFNWIRLILWYHIRIRIASFIELNTETKYSSYFQTIWRPLLSNTFSPK